MSLDHDNSRKTGVVKPGNSVPLHANRRNRRAGDGVSLPVDSRKTGVLLSLNSPKTEKNKTF